MQENNFENQVKDLLYNHSESAPNVMGKVFEKRTPLYIFKNRLILHKYKLMAAAVLIGLLAFLFNMKSDKTDSVLPIVAETETNQVDETPNTEAESIENQMAQIDETIAEPTKNTNPNSTSGVATNGTQQTQSNINNSDLSTSSPGTKILRYRMLKELANTKKQGKGDDGSWGTGTPQSEKPIGNTSGEFVNNTTESNTNKQDVPTDQTQSEKDQTQNTTNTANDTKTTIAKTEAPTSSSEDNTGGDEDFELPKTKDGKWSVSFNTVIGSGSRNLDAMGDMASVVVRDATETANLSYGAELLLNYKLSDNFDLYSGFNYFNRREKMVYMHNTQVTDMDITSKKVIEHHPVFGTREVTVYDTSYTTRNVQSNGDFNNSYKHFYIPLGLRYTLYLNETVGIYFDVNGGLEVRTKTSGTILNDQYQELSLDNGFARTSLGNMVGVNAGVSFLVDERLSVLTGLRGKMFLNPTNNQDYPINQYDKGFGLMVGLKYDL